MLFPLSKIIVLLFLIFAYCNSAWAQSKSAKFADLTIGDFNATINKRVFHTVDKTHFTAPRYPMERPTKFTDLTIGDVRAIIIKREFPVEDKTHYITPKYLKKQAFGTLRESSLKETSPKIRLMFPSNALGSQESLLSSPLLKDTSATTSQTNKSLKNYPERVFPNKPKLELKLAPRWSKL